MTRPNKTPYTVDIDTRSLKQFYGCSLEEAIARHCRRGYLASEPWKNGGGDEFVTFDRVYEIQEHLEAKVHDETYGTEIS